MAYSVVNRKPALVLVAWFFLPPLVGGWWAISMSCLRLECPCLGGWVGFGWPTSVCSSLGGCHTLSTSTHCSGFVMCLGAGDYNVNHQHTKLQSTHRTFQVTKLEPIRLTNDLSECLRFSVVTLGNVCKREPPFLPTNTKSHALSAAKPATGRKLP